MKSQVRGPNTATPTTGNFSNMLVSSTFAGCLIGCCCCETFHTELDNSLSQLLEAQGQSEGCYVISWCLTWCDHKSAALAGQLISGWIYWRYVIQLFDPYWRREFNSQTSLLRSESDVWCYRGQWTAELRRVCHQLVWRTASWRMIKICCICVSD